MVQCFGFHCPVRIHNHELPRLAGCPGLWAIPTRMVYLEGCDSTAARTLYKSLQPGHLITKHMSSDSADSTGITIWTPVFPSGIIAQFELEATSVQKVGFKASGVRGLGLQYFGGFSP